MGQPARANSPRSKHRRTSKSETVTTVDRPKGNSAVNRYDWNDTTKIGARAEAAVRNFLASDAAVHMWQKVKAVFDVGKNTYHQKRDTDLLLIVNENDGLFKASVEVKGDRNDHTGNLFLETLSDVERETPGAFIASRADWFFYYFVNSGHLFCLRMADAVPWFEKNNHLFPEKEVASDRDRRTWRTRGKLIPISLLLRDLPSTFHFAYRGGWRYMDSRVRNWHE